MGDVDQQLDRRIEEAIVDLLEARGPDKTICPSEAARLVAPDDWRRLMDATRRVAARLVERGDIAVTQRGREVDPEQARGPVRLRLANHTVRLVTDA